MDEGPINVLLADDGEGFLTSLRELVDRQPELHVVAVARNGIEAIECADLHDPDAAGRCSTASPQSRGYGRITPASA